MMREELITKYPKREDISLEQHVNGAIQTIFTKVATRAAHDVTTPCVYGTPEVQHVVRSVEKTH